MRVGESVRNYTLGSFLYGWNIRERPRVFYYQTKAYVDRFLVKGKPSNRVLSVMAGSDRIFFRDNWFDPRNLYSVFWNDYNMLDRNVFRGLGTFVDIGANLGFISLCARRASPGCEVFCFEPLADNARICSMNNPGAKVEQVGLGSSEGSMKVLVDDFGFMASNIKFGYGQRELEVPVTTLDKYFTGRKTGFDLMKIDVEGFEIEVLKGGKRTIPLAKRVIAEVHSDELLDEFSSIMRGYGFKENGGSVVDKGVHITDWFRTRN
jgi:FkbM family methyltransferase